MPLPANELMQKNRTCYNHLHADRTPGRTEKARGVRIGRRDIIASALLALLVVVFFHNALLGGEQFYAGDTYRFFYPLKKMVADSVRGGEAPVWNPLVHSGMPLHAALQAAVFYPFSLLFYCLPFDLAYKWHIALHVLLAALGTYFLMRRWRLERIPAALAGVTYAFSGYMISFIDGLNIFSSIAWLPVVFGLFERAVEKPGILSVALASLAVAAQTLAGDPVSGYYTFLICGAYWMVMLTRSAVRRRPRAETLAKVCVLPAIAILAFVLSYVQIGPSQELTRYSTRTVAVSYETATRHSLTPLQLLTLFVPYLFGNPIENIHDWGRIFTLHFPLVRSLYVGAVPLVLLPIAVVTFRERRMYFFGGVFLVSLLLSLGKYTPIYGIAYSVLPMLGKFRYPTKCFFATTFAMAVLAGYGLQYLISQDEGEIHRLRRVSATFVSWFSVLVVAVASAWLVFALCDRFALHLSDGLLLKMSSADSALTRRLIPRMKREMLQASIMFTALGFGLWAWRKGALSRRLFGIIAVIYVAVDLLPVNYRAMDTIPDSFYTPPRIDSVLNADPGFFRLYRTPIDVEQHIAGLDIHTPADYYMWNREILSPNFGTLFGYAYTDGYESANLLWHNLFIRFVEGAPPLIRPRLLGLVNVKYIFASHPVTHPDLVLKTSLDGNVFLYENARCLDRAYFVPRAIVAPTEDVALAALASDRFDPYETVVLVEKGGPGSLNPQPGAGGFEVATPPGFSFQTMDVLNEKSAPRMPPPKRTPYPAKILKYSPNSVVLSVDAPSDGYVVLCDAYYPEWRAYVNGSEANVLRGDCTVRAVPVSEGSNTVEFVYDTDSFRRAAMVSLVALALCVGVGAIDVVVRRRRARGGNAPRPNA